MANCLNSQKLPCIDLFNVASTIHTTSSLLPLIAPKRSVKRVQVRKIYGKNELRNITREHVGSSKHLTFNSKTERHKIALSEKWKRPSCYTANRYTTLIKQRLIGSNIKTNKSTNEIIKKIETLCNQPISKGLLQIRKEQLFPSLDRVIVFYYFLIE